MRAPTSEYVFVASDGGGEFSPCSSVDLEVEDVVGTGGGGEGDSGRVTTVSLKATCLEVEEEDTDDLLDFEDDDGGGGGIILSSPDV